MTMQPILKSQFAALGEIIGKGHAQFGKVSIRRPYPDDDEGGGDFGSPSPFESHPFLMDTPEGAPSDMTRDINSNPRSAEEAARERYDELTPSLQKQPSIQMAPSKNYTATPRAPG